MQGEKAKLSTTEKLAIEYEHLDNSSQRIYFINLVSQMDKSVIKYIFISHTNLVF